MSTNAVSIESAPANAVQTLGDRIELELLVSGLGQFLDAHDAERAPLLFSDDVVVTTLGGTAEGRDAVVAQALRNHQVPTQHLIANVVSEIDGDDARMTANLLVVFADGPPARVGPQQVELPTAALTLGERYRFEARRGDGGWRLTRIAIDPVWAAGARLG
ncbi:nuclear transport factor 2 family protein [Conexibacter sp. JD483]|uniref:nuclear transport factor 2 family protein n=1 Tax=unclassified Conexibacter TaxID=2627773 RepID=UPI00271F3C51|nr:MULTISPECIES: nuclear transport factor 2 family protein [unclassified Conexibacter]MDO8186696.1 nuclear transport factor 2 family protein [Conexibacter sp. CPCC 205706]MDO8200416.1 nuclear transport factor 2 family protein [Conexibacter sp. CPCC 205762]MDR9371080.1 nuclear transport factor 2 family protein [Conexibacter sp. JD483]